MNLPRSVRGVCTGPSRKHPHIQKLAVAEVREVPTSMKVLGYHDLAYQVRVHRNCMHNQYKALSERHITDRTYIRFDNAVFRTTQKAFNWIYRKIQHQNLQPLNIQQIPPRYTGGKRKVYQRAADYVEEHGLQKRHARIKMFVKPDKHPLCKIFDKAPRAIQYRSPEFNASLARFLIPIEEAVYQITDRGQRCFAKGRNAQQRAQDFLNIYNSMKNPAIIELDHAKFDSCVRYEHLKRLHKFYLRCVPSRQLARLLLFQINNRGRSSHFRYKVRGTRMSGDFDTGLGNSLLNFSVLTTWLRACGVEAYVYVDGDDSLIFIEKEDLDKLDFSKIESYGFESEWAIKDITAEFCKTKLIRSDPPIMARDPYRVLAHFNVALNDYGPKTWPLLLAGKAMCESVANTGVPYIEEYFQKLVTDTFLIPREDSYKWSWVKTHQKGKVTDLAKQDLYDAWGFGVEEAMLLGTPTTYASVTRKSTQRQTKQSHVLADESLQRAWEGYEQLDPSRGLCSGPSCSCIRAACDSSCGARGLSFKAPTATTTSGDGTASGATTSS